MCSFSLFLCLIRRLDSTPACVRQTPSPLLRKNCGKVTENLLRIYDSHRKASNAVGHEPGITGLRSELRVIAFAA